MPREEAWSGVSISVSDSCAWTAAGAGATVRLSWSCPSVPAREVCSVPETRSWSQLSERPKEDDAALEGASRALLAIQRG